MSKEREELEKKKAAKKKSNFKSNMFKAGGILVAIAGIIVGANSKKS